MKKILTLLFVVFFAAAAWYAFQSQTSRGTEVAYPYQCENGVAFTLTPAEDFSWVAIAPGENASFTAETLAYQNNLEGMFYAGTRLGFLGTGETAVLNLDGTTTSCSISTANDSPSIDWNDVDSRDIVANDALVTSQNMTGKWQSTDDAKFVREYRADGTYTDSYAGTETGRGLWFVFTSKNAPQTPFPLEGNDPYIQQADADGMVTYFKITNLTLGELSMIYMDRGGVLNFRLVQ